MRNQTRNLSGITSLLLYIVFTVAGAGNSLAQVATSSSSTISSGLTSTSTGTVVSSPTQTTGITSYGCFKDLNGDGYYDGLGEVGACYATPQGMICNIDATDCIIPSTAAAGTCPNLSDIFFDATTNQCAVPPRCSSGYSYDSSYGQCDIKQTGVCPSGAVSDPTTGICKAAPICSSGSYNTRYSQCVVPVAVVCPTGSSYDQSMDLCYSAFSCPTGYSYRSTSNLCLNDADSTIFQQPTCPSGTVLNTTTSRCEAAPPCPTTGCPLNSSLDSSTGICYAAATCPTGGLIDTTLSGSPCASNSVPTGTPACVSGLTYNSTTARCEAQPTTYDSTMKSCVDKSPTTSCYEGTNVAINNADGMCESYPECPLGSGMMFDPTLGVCIAYQAATCPTDGAFNPAKNRCEAPQGCTSGTTTATDSLCLGNGPLVNPPICPSGTTFSSATNLCRVNATCPAGSLLSSTNNLCDAAPICSQGTFDASQHACAYIFNSYVTNADCPAGVTIDPGVGECSAPVGPHVSCPQGTIFDPDLWLCTATPTCKYGFYDPDFLACVITNTGYVASTCPINMTLNTADNRCEATLTCPSTTTYDTAKFDCTASPTCVAGYSLDPNAHYCILTDRVCPLDSSLPCQDYNGKKQCSASKCSQLSTAATTTTPDPPDTSQKNDAPVDPSGGCTGQLIIFAGRQYYCRPPGLATFETNCCSSAHPGKFSHVQDLNTAVNDAVAGYKDVVDAYLTNDTKSVVISEKAQGYNLSGSPPSQTIAITDGGSPQNFNLRKASDFAEPSLNYSSSLLNGLTTIETTYRTCLGSELETDDCAGITQPTAGSTIENIADPSLFSAWLADMKRKFRTCLDKGLVPLECTSDKLFNYIDVRQSFGNFTNDIFVDFNTQDPGVPAVVPIFHINTFTGTCDVVGNFSDPACKFQCYSSMSGGNMVLKVNYLDATNNLTLEEVATVTKGPSGTSAQIKQIPYNDCQNFHTYDQVEYTLGVNKPAILATTSLSGGKYSAMNVLHTEWMPEINNIYDVAFGMLLSVGFNGWNWLTSPCRPSEQIADQNRDAGKCHVIGRYCISKLMGNCMQRKESNCCFSSKLARIIHEQGRPQLQKFGADGGWGIPEAPNCEGFSPEEFQMLDFSKMDLSEYFATIVAPVASELQNKLTDKVNTFYNNTNSQSK